jgi:chromosome segregation ATPase
MSSEALQDGLDRPASAGAEPSGDLEKAVALRRQAYRELPLAGPGVGSAIFPATASYSEIAAAFAGADVGADAGQMAAALASLYREAGFEAWVFHFGRPPSFVHAVTLVRVSDAVLVQDAYFNRGFDLDVEILLDAVAAGAARGETSSVEDRKLVVIDPAETATEALRWITAHADQELAPIHTLRRFTLSWTVAAAASSDPTVAAALGARDASAARGLDALMLHPLGVQYGEKLVPPWEPMPVIADWFRRHEGGEGVATSGPERDRRAEYLFALSHRLSRVGEAILDPDLANVTGAFAELSDTVRAASAQVVAAKDREQALRQDCEALTREIAEATDATRRLEARAGADAAAAQTAREALERRLAEVTAALAAAEAGLEEARGRREELSVAAAVEATERRGLEARLAEEAVHRTAAERTIEGLNLGLTKAQSETAAVRVSLAAAATERDSAVQARRTDQERARTEVETLRAAIAQRDTERARTEGELDGLRGALAESEAKAADERVRWQTALEAAQAAAQSAAERAAEEIETAARDAAAASRDAQAAFDEQLAAGQLRLSELEQLASERALQVETARREVSVVAAAGARAERQQAERLQGLETRLAAATAALSGLEAERDGVTAALQAERAAFEMERAAAAERSREQAAKQDRRLARLAEFAGVIDGDPDAAAATDPFGALENLERSYNALKAERDGLQAEAELRRARDRRRLGARLKRLLSPRRA